MSQIVCNNGEQASGLARWILDNVADAPDGAGIVVTQQGPNVYVASDLASATIDQDGEVDES
jgi:hypothetical protein